MDIIKPGVDILYVDICTMNIFLMQLGFSFFEIGSVRTKHVPTIILKNVLTSIITAVCWWIIGYGIAYGKDQGNFIGSSHFVGLNFKNSIPSHWFNQWGFCANMVYILTGSIAERMTLKAFILLVIYVSSWIYPVVVHWAWSQKGWLFLKGFHDLAGDGAIHLLSGVVGLVSTKILGERIGRFDKTKQKDFEPFNIPFQHLGTCILWFSWWGFNSGSLFKFKEASILVGIINVNTTLSGISGGFTIYIYKNFLQSGNKANTTDLCVGILSGLVGITAAADIVKPWASIIIGTISIFFFQLFSKLLLYYHIDDPLDASPLHLGCGMWGLLSVGIFSLKDGLIYTSDGQRLLWQFIAVISITAWGIICIIPFLYILKHFDCLRITKQQEIEGSEWNEIEIQGIQQQKIVQINLPVLVYNNGDSDLKNHNSNNNNTERQNQPVPVNGLIFGTSNSISQ